ncbi:MAG TPA: hypothetical protein VN678_00265 [Acidobacteriaceae bacterium]|nr:hypothetical protein [Acidobacteriaceae bacterium]
MSRADDGGATSGLVLRPVKNQTESGGEKRTRIKRGWFGAHPVLAWSVVAVVAPALGLGVWVWRHSPPRPAAPPARDLPVVRVEGGVTKVEVQLGTLLGEVGEYDDELTAYLRFEYLRGLKQVDAGNVLMVSKEGGQGEPKYRLYILLPNDLLAGGAYLAELEAARHIERFRLEVAAEAQVNEWKKQTELFYEAYNKPVQEKLLSLPASYLTTAVGRFILFKVKTDRRVREQIEPVPPALSEEQSQEFAADMIEVAKFYQIPLSMLLGIGAMENNYLDVRGDLQHSVWKRRAQRGDIVLKRRKGRVLVSNYSIGPWQITRETLRYVHALYLKDKRKRDYTQLPERLRPPDKLDLDHVDSHVLTTYAGLLLSQLLEHFNGDVEKAEGAYNGGTKNPNAAYAEGVSLVSTYAHRVLSMAAARKGIAVSETPIKVSPAAGSSEAVTEKSEPMEAPGANGPGVMRQDDLQKD